MSHCQANVESCNAEEYECLCGVMSCSIHGHVDEGDNLPDGWECGNQVDEKLTEEEMRHWIENHGGRPSEEQRQYWQQRCQSL